MKKRSFIGVLSAVVLFAVSLTLYARDWNLPEPVATALNGKYPGGNIVEVEQERERGVRVFSVKLSVPGRRIEADVMENGKLIEAEEEIALTALPEALTKALPQLIGATYQLIDVDKDEIFFVPNRGGFQELQVPIIRYDIEYKDMNQKKKEIILQELDGKFIVKRHKLD